jgi:hypothetical protein
MIYWHMTGVNFEMEGPNVLGVTPKTFGPLASAAYDMFIFSVIKLKFNPTVKEFVPKRGILYL